MTTDLIPGLPDTDIEVDIVDNRITGRFQQAAYTAASLAAVNPVLLDKEIVYETDTGFYKIGDGATAWNNLPHFGSASAGGGLVYSSSSATTVTIGGGMYLNALATTPITCDVNKDSWDRGAQFAVLVTRGDVPVSLPGRLMAGRAICKMEGIKDLIGMSSQKKVYCFMGINDGGLNSIQATTYITINCALYD